MTKINEGVGSGGTKPSSDEFNLEKEIKESELFNDEIDQLKGGTIAIEVVRAIKPRFNVGDKDSFEAEKITDFGGDAPRDLDPDISKKRRESDTGLTFQMKSMLQKNIKG